MLRAATAADFDAIAAITPYHVPQTAIHFPAEPPTARAPPPPPGRARGPGPRGGLDEDDGGAGGATVVRGYAKAGPWRTREAYRWTAEVGLYLTPEHRGRGLGGRLLTALVDALVARGFRSAIAGIALPNPASVALHERHGFVAAGVIRDAGWKHDAWRDVGFWQRRLRTDETPPPSSSTATT